MSENELPSNAQLITELNELCGKIGYRIGGTQEALERIPGLVGLTIVGGPTAPTSPTGWQERRNAIRNVLREIAKKEVGDRLGEPYPYAATKVFRLDEPRPLEPAAHRALGDIQASLDEKFGGDPGGKSFFKKHRPLLFDVIAESLLTRERRARKPAEHDKSSTNKTKAGSTPEKAASPAPRQRTPPRKSRAQERGDLEKRLAELRRASKLGKAAARKKREQRAIQSDKNPSLWPEFPTRASEIAISVALALLIFSCCS